jgi:hypothetical protein
MASINTVADALIATIESATGIRATPIVASPQLPSVMVYPDDPMLGGDGAAYYETFGGGLIALRMVACVLVSAVNVEGQQRWLNDVVGPFGQLSIPRAIFDNPTLGSDPNEATGGAAATMTASVGKPHQYGIATLGDGSLCLQTKIPIQVMTRGDR